MMKIDIKLFQWSFNDLISDPRNFFGANILAVESADVDNMNG